MTAKDGGNAVRLSGTIFAHTPVKTVSGFLLRTCRNGGGVMRILYPIQQIPLNERALIALCLGLILLVCFISKTTNK
ncbi:MAG: hypothetical protein HFP77_01490 [Methylococcales symbiont of Iophon sp. n. MRB-2018]|nr:MAG: hypothetical protein HFP77_01490 [Methylococcales symbiont of Iophon sp. n. MRB-2018]